LNDHLAACNLALGTISFYRKRSDSPLAFEQHPRFELSESLSDPDGLAFSASGEWLAVANHGNHSVSIFQRRNRGAAGDRVRFSAAPVAVIADTGFRYPHSVAFDASNHLFVTSAGANFFSVFAPTKLGDRMQWSPLPGGQQVVGSESGFRAINSENAMEGGPKGIVIQATRLPCAVLRTGSCCTRCRLDPLDVGRRERDRPDVGIAQLRTGRAQSSYHRIASAAAANVRARFVAAVSFASRTSSRAA
jgi:hypothetical protein